MKRFYPYFKLLRPVRFQFGLGLFFGIISGVASGAGLPLITKQIVPMVTKNDAPMGMELILVLASIPLIFLFRSLGAFFNAYLMAYCGMHVLEQIRVHAFTKIQQLPLAFFDKNQTGDLMSRITGDTVQIQSAIIKVVNDLIKQPGTLISAIGFLIYLSFEHKEIGFVLIALGSVPACVLPIRILGTRILKRAKKLQSQSGQITHILKQNLFSMREIRAYNLAEREIKKFREACKTFMKASLQVVKIQSITKPNYRNCFCSDNCHCYLCCYCQKR